MVSMIYDLAIAHKPAINFNTGQKDYGEDKNTMETKPYYSYSKNYQVLANQNRLL